MGTFSDNVWWEFFGDWLDALKHTVEGEQARAPRRGVRGSPNTRRIT